MKLKFNIFKLKKHCKQLLVLACIKLFLCLENSLVIFVYQACFSQFMLNTVIAFIHNLLNFILRCLN